eukprot:2654724-Amphidinium_carterae.1
MCIRDRSLHWPVKLEDLDVEAARCTRCTRTCRQWSHSASKQTFEPTLVVRSALVHESSASGRGAFDICLIRDIAPRSMLCVEGHVSDHVRSLAACAWRSSGQ